MSSSNPRFSIVMPTYNRADTILRSIDSMRAQTYDDWELLVVDDGSTDNTQEKIANLDPRIRVIPQANQGMNGARNTGLRAATGDYIGFLDSDDEATPHHLAVAAAFFEAFPEEHVLTTEFWEDFGHGSYVKHFRIECEKWAPQIARNVGSRAFEGSPPEGDPYLWIYESRSPAGDWIRPIVDGTPYANPFHYRGRIFHGWRWEYLGAMQSTVISRKALETVGEIDPRFRTIEWSWMARLGQLFTVNLVSVPSCIKHEYGLDGQLPIEGHLVTGKTATKFNLEMLQMFEEVFWKDDPTSQELQGIRGYRQLLVGRAALLQGKLDVAREYLGLASKAYPGLESTALYWLASLAPHPEVSRLAYRGSLKVGNLGKRARRLFGI